MRMLYVVGWALLLGGLLIILVSSVQALSWQGCRAWGCWLLVGVAVGAAVLVYVTSVLGLRFL